MRKFLKNGNPEKELNYKQYKTLVESFIKKSKKSYYLDLIDSYKCNTKKKLGCYEKDYWKQKSQQCLSLQFYQVKNREIFDKKELRKSLITISVISVPT